MSAQKIAITAISIALVTVLVAAVPVPIPATGGYTHPGAIAEVFVAISFGPFVGAVAAGLGASIADLILGYATFAPLTLIAHGALGLLVGALGWRKGLPGKLTGWIAGGLALVAIYFIGEATVYGFGLAGAVPELSINLFQVGLGILGLALHQLVRQAYPQLDQLAEDSSYTEAPL